MNKRPLFQTLSKAFELSRNTPLTSIIRLLSNAVCISSIIESNWTIHKPPGRKPDCEECKGLLL